MYRFFLKITLLSLTFLSIQPALCMLMPHTLNKEHLKSYIKRRHNTLLEMDLLHKLNNTSQLLLENSPFNFSQLPNDLQLKIFALMPPHHKNQLQKTCTFFNQKGSIQSPHVWNVSCHNPLYIQEKDISKLILKAGLFNKADILENLLQNTQQRSFIYEYSYINNNFKRNYYFDLRHITPTENIENVLNKYKCTTQHIDANKVYIEPTPLIIACYAQDNAMTASITNSDKNFIEGELDHALIIAINHENLKIITMLCNIKNSKSPIINQEFPATYTMFFDCALKMGKIKAFETLVDQNRFILNMIPQQWSSSNSTTDDQRACNTYLSAMILENKNTENIKAFAQIVQCHGGKTTRELRGEDYIKEDNDILRILWPNRYAEKQKILSKQASLRLQEQQQREREITHLQNELDYAEQRIRSYSYYTYSYSTCPSMYWQSQSELQDLKYRRDSLQRELSNAEQKLQNPYHPLSRRFF